MEEAIDYVYNRNTYFYFSDLSYENEFSNQNESFEKCFSKHFMGESKYKDYDHDKELQIVSTNNNTPVENQIANYECFNDNEDEVQPNYEEEKIEKITEQLEDISLGENNENLCQNDLSLVTIEIDLNLREDEKNNSNLPKSTKKLFNIVADSSDSKSNNLPSSDSSPCESDIEQSHQKYRSEKKEALIKKFKKYLCENILLNFYHHIFRISQRNHFLKKQKIKLRKISKIQTATIEFNKNFMNQTILEAFVFENEKNLRMMKKLEDFDLKDLELKEFLKMKVKDFTKNFIQSKYFWEGLKKMEKDYSEQTRNKVVDYYLKLVFGDHSQFGIIDYFLKYEPNRKIKKK